MSTVALKQQNKLSMMYSLLRRGTATKGDLSAETKLSFATVSNLLKELMAEEIVQEYGYAESGGGRKPFLYTIKSGGLLFVGVEIQVEQLTCVLTGLDSRRINHCTEALDAHEEPFSIIQRIRTMVERLLADCGKTVEQVMRIGIAISGPIDENGIIIAPPNMPSWRNVPLRDLVERELGIACCVEKGANAGMIGEIEFGNYKEVHHVVYILADAGIGAGLYINGEVYRGVAHGAGSIGHTVVSFDGPPCNCGNRGCLEAFASGLAIEREIAAMKGGEWSVEQILSPSLAAQEEINRVISTAGKCLGIGVANLCNTLNPQLVLIGGALANSDVYFESARAEARRHILPNFSNRIQIERACLGKMSSAMGAGFIAKYQFLQNYG